MNTAKNYVKLGFLKGLISIEAPTSTPPTPEQLFKLFLTSVISICVLAAILVTALIILKLSLWNLTWLVPTCLKRGSWLATIKRLFKK
jgi:hypothetical protein